MGATTISTVEDVFKILYPGGIEPLLYDTSDGGKLFAWLPKAYDFEGLQWNITIQTTGTEGANNYADALDAMGNPEIDTFVVPRVGEDYAHINVSTKSVAASRSNKGALRQTMGLSVESAKYAVKRSMASMLWGDGSGARARLSTGTPSGTTLTLLTRGDVTRFEKNMRVVSSASTYAARNPGELTVSKVNRKTGVITFTQTVTTGIPAIAASDYLYRKGDSAPFNGVFGWIPKADATRTGTLYGVDRSTDEMRLAGSYVDGGGAPMYDVLEDACGENDFQGGRGNVFFVNTLDWKRLKKELHGLQRITIPTSNPKIGMSALAFDGPNGPVAFIVDKDCPQGHALLTNRKCWLLRGLRNLPHMADEDGQKWRMAPSSPHVRAELRCWGNLGCYRPQDNTAIKW